MFQPESGSWRYHAAGVIIIRYLKKYILVAIKVNADYSETVAGKTSH